MLFPFFALSLFKNKLHTMTDEVKELKLITEELKKITSQLESVIKKPYQTKEDKWEEHFRVKEDLK